MKFKVGDVIRPNKKYDSDFTGTILTANTRSTEYTIRWSDLHNPTDVGATYDGVWIDMDFRLASKLDKVLT